MMYKIILDNEWATMRYHEADQYMYHTFHQAIRGPIFRDVMNQGLAVLERYGATKWLSDDRKNAEFTPEDIQFALTDWGPRAAAAGWKFWALVVPEDIAGRAGMQDIATAFFEMGVRLAVFTSVEPAREWLLKM